MIPKNFHYRDMKPRFCPLLQDANCDCSPECMLFCVDERRYPYCGLEANHTAINWKNELQFQEKREAEIAALEEAEKEKHPECDPFGNKFQ